VYGRQVPVSIQNRGCHLGTVYSQDVNNEKLDEKSAATIISSCFTDLRKRSGSQKPI
jgi:hypothetical protein